MGVHFVRHIDDVLDANDPEALVYEVERNGHLQLVAVESKARCVTAESVST